ncbi:hypothetical protein [Sphingomonas sp.]|uniref:hypothetical protein n=1 Tax=Sphingomonas sp. TaxID=28214 RepID=UPI0025D454F0|nr:hypothetical protein [Sphingomonas sp.]
MDYQIAFDLTARPEQIQPVYGFYALFLAIGFGLLALAMFLQRRRLRSRNYVLAFSVFWLGFTAFMIFKEIEDTSYIRSQVQRKAFATVEGCLDYFQPGDPEGSKTTAGNERWSIRGTEFDYGQGEVRRGYHLVEPRGGAVHPHTRVRVSYVTSDFYGRREIVKLAVAQRACQPAPHINSK